MDFYLEALWRGGITPAAVYALGLLALRHSAALGERARRVGLGLAFGLGFLAGYATFDWVVLWPATSWNWLAYLPLAAALTALLPVVMLPALAVLAAWLLVPDFAGFPRLAWLTPVAISILVLAAALRPLPYRLLGPGLPIVWLLTALGCAVVLMLSGNAKLAQLAGIVAALLAVAAALAWRWPLPEHLGSLTPALAVLLPGLLWNARFASYSEVPLASYVLVMAAPLASWLVALDPLRRLPGFLRGPIHVTLVAIPLAIAIGLGWSATSTGEDAEW
jgi:hypothetical protein